METKKIISAVLVFTVLAMCLVVLTGCGGFDAKAMAGKYTLIEMSEGDEKYGEDQLKAMKDSLGLEFTMELKEDGTGKMEMYGESQDLKFDKDNITIDGDSAKYEFKDNKITIKEKDITMVFKKN